MVQKKGKISKKESNKGKEGKCTYEYNLSAMTIHGGWPKSLINWSLFNYWSVLWLLCLCRKSRLIGIPQIRLIAFLHWIPVNPDFWRKQSNHRTDHSLKTDQLLRLLVNHHDQSWSTNYIDRCTFTFPPYLTSFYLFSPFFLDHKVPLYSFMWLN